MSGLRLAEKGDNHKFQSSGTQQSSTTVLLVSTTILSTLRRLLDTVDLQLDQHTYLLPSIPYLTSSHDVTSRSCL